MGPTMSPTISISPFIQPNQALACVFAGGTISATGLPNRVTRTGLRVRPTSLSTDRHVALNLEIGISRISILDHDQTIVMDHGLTDDPFTHCVEDQFRHAVQVQLLQDVRAVRLN